MIRAVIFDMDGVLIDSESFWADSQSAAFASVGLPFTPEMYLETMGRRVDEVVAYWRNKADWGPGSDREVQDRIVTGVVERVTNCGLAMPGVRDALDFCKSLDLRLGLASSSVYRVIGAVVDRLALSSEFDCVYSAEDEAFGKPHPGVYLTTARRLGVQPHECVAVEDSMTGLLAAKAAGMKCVAVPHPAARRDPRFSIADVVLDSLTDLGGTWSLLGPKRAGSESPLATPQVETALRVGQYDG